MTVILMPILRKFDSDDCVVLSIGKHSCASAEKDQSIL